MTRRPTTFQAAGASIDEGQPVQVAGPSRTDPGPRAQSLVSYSGLEFVAETGHPVVGIRGGSLTFSDLGSGMVFASVEPGRADGGVPSFAVSFRARATGVAWLMALDAHPGADSEAERSGTLVEYRESEGPGIRVLRDSWPVGGVPEGLATDSNWHPVKVSVLPGTIAVFVDRKQIASFSRRNPSSWIGLGGHGEFRDLEVRR